MDERRSILKFLGGPLDGCEIDTGVGVRNIDEVIFRTTEFFPAEPDEIVYRRDAWGSLELGQILDGMGREVFVTVFRPAPVSTLVATLQEFRRRLMKREEGLRITEEKKQ